MVYGNKYDVKKIVILYKNSEGETQRIVQHHPRLAEFPSWAQFQFLGELCLFKNPGPQVYRMEIECALFSAPRRSIFNEYQK